MRIAFPFQQQQMCMPLGKLLFNSGVVQPCSNSSDKNINYITAFLILRTIWYELQARDWPITNQHVEAIIWQVGSGEGIKKVLGEISLGKEVTVSWHGCSMKTHFGQFWT